MPVVVISLLSSFPLVFASGIDYEGPPRLPNVLLTQILSSENQAIINTALSAPGLQSWLHAR